MANDLPWFPFYAKDFSNDGKVEAMSTTEVGSYILLLCKAWYEDPRGTLPADDAVLARWSRMNPAEWSAAKPRVMACFTLRSDGRWHQKRMEQEVSKLTALASVRSEAGRRGAQARWQTHAFANGNANAEPMAKGWQTDCGSGCDSEPNPQTSEVGGAGGAESRERDPTPARRSVLPEGNPAVAHAHTAAGLAQEWCAACARRFRGLPADNENDIKPTMAELLRHGHDPEAVRREIWRDGRDRNERVEAFVRRFGSTKPCKDKDQMESLLRQGIEASRKHRTGSSNGRDDTL